MSLRWRGNLRVESGGRIAENRPTGKVWSDADSSVLSLQSAPSLLHSATHLRTHADTCECISCIRIQLSPPCPCVSAYPRIRTCPTGNARPAAEASPPSQPWRPPPGAPAVRGVGSGVESAWWLWARCVSGQELACVVAFCEVCGEKREPWRENKGYLQQLAPRRPSSQQK